VDYVTYKICMALDMSLRNSRRGIPGTNPLVGSLIPVFPARQ